MKQHPFCGPGGPDSFDLIFPHLQVEISTSIFNDLSTFFSTPNKTRRFDVEKALKNVRLFRRQFDVDLTSEMPAGSQQRCLESPVHYDCSLVETMQLVSEKIKS